MAMRENLRNIEEVGKTSLMLQQRKRLEQKKKQEQKENAVRLQYDVKRFLRKEFEKYIYLTCSSASSDFYLLDRKKQLLEEAKENILNKNTITYKNGETLQFYNDIELIQLEEAFNKNYYKILKEVTKEKEEDEKARFWQQCDDVQVVQEQKQLNLYPILKAFICIIFFPIVFIGAIFYGLLKNSK